MNSLRRTALVIALFALPASQAAAQSPALDLGRVQVTRASLDSLLRQFDEASNSPSYGPELRSRARQQAALVRARLRDGDFQVGDRIRLAVAGESSLTDTFTVQTGRLIDLPNIGHVSVSGLLRSELRDSLQARLGAFLRNPDVRAQPLIRLSVLGSVAQQGFYTVPVDITIDDLLMAAGGPAGTANLERLRLQRGGEELWSSDELTESIARGRTLDELNVQAGDQLLVPQRTQRDWRSIMQVVAIATTVPFTIIALINIFSN